MRRRLGLAAAVVALACAPTAASAHLVDTRLGDFYSAALHPLTDLQQILPWIALSFLAAFQGPRAARWAIVVFPLGLFAGGLIAMVASQPAYASVLSLAIMAVLGLAVAAAVRIPLWVLVGSAGAMGVLHGIENGVAMTAATDHVLFLSGMVAAGYLVVTLATGSALAFLGGTGGWRPIALRAAGSWSAAVSIMVLGLQLAMPGAT